MYSKYWVKDKKDQKQKTLGLAWIVVGIAVVIYHLIAIVGIWRLVGAVFQNTVFSTIFCLVGFLFILAGSVL